MSIRILKPTPGPTTTERVYQLILDNPQGISAKEIGKIINRPVSMIQTCLKYLKSSRQICAKKSEDGMCLIYHPNFNQ